MSALAHPVGAAVFEVQDIAYRYEQVEALSGLSLQVRRGERLALMGANGSGKSTLLRILAALYFPQCGRVSFFGDTITEARMQEEAFSLAFRRRVGIVFQNPDIQLFNPSVFDEVAFGPLQLRWPKQQIREKVRETLHLLRIEHLADRAPHRLSGGEKKRVALASVLILDPEILLLDEPCAALDPASQTQIVEFLTSWRDGAKTVVTATHDLTTLAEIADRCYVFDGGRVVAEDTSFNILHDAGLLERTGLIRPLDHAHDPSMPSSHPHLHIHESLLNR